MKKIVIGCMMILSTSLLAQEKGSLSKAQMYLDKKDLASAKKEIDAVLTDVKQADKGKVWFTKGQIYQAIALSDKAEEQKLAPQAVDEAVAAYKKVESLEKPNSFYVQRLKQTTTDPNTLQVLPPIYDEFANTLINKGAVCTEKEDYLCAIEMFESAMKINPNLDTMMNLYIMQSAYQVKENEKLPEATRKNATEKMIASGKKLASYGYKKEFIYQVLVSYYLENEQYEPALEIAKIGTKLYPTDKYLNQASVQIYGKTGKTQEAIASIEKVLASDPNNADMLFTLGLMYDNNGEKAKAIENYEKCLKAKPTYFEALVNLSVYYFNLGNNKIKERNNLFDAKGKPTDLAKINKLDEEVNSYFKQALPYLERAVEQKQDKDVMNTLAFVYQQLKMNDKYNALKAKIGNDDDD